MPRPRFSEALLTRRQELGLSISQASRILKLREDVLVAFEEGDYDHMPQSGYAQGMLSSYARYLGLNAREIVDLFQEEIYEYRHGTSSHELRRRTRQTQAGRGVGGYDLVNEAGSRPKAYVEYRPLLPTSGGPAGDMGDFATTAPARPRSSVPLAGTGRSVPGTRGSYAGSTSGLPLASYAPEQRRPYNSAPARERASASTARRRAVGQRRRSDDQASRLISERQNAPYRTEDSGARTGRLYRRDDVSTRRVRPSEYTDDLRYDERANPYAPASTISGRRSSRNIAAVERPNVRRRSAQAGRSGRGGRRPPRRPGVLGVLEEFFSDPRRALLAIILGLTVVLTAILVLSVSSCVSGGGRDKSGGQTVAVNSATQQGTSGETGDEAADQDDQGDQADAPASTDEGDADASADDGQATDDADADGDGEGADAADEEPKETVVEVSVADGEYTWVEVVCDGMSTVADGITGPWSQTYTVYDSITVQVDDASAVTVTENGEPVDFTSRAGGVNTVTIKGTPAPVDDGTGDAGNGDASAEGTAQDGGTTAE